MRAIALAAYLSISVGLPATAQEAVYLIRHAEQELSGNDPSITEAGKARAASWAKMLQYVGLDVIYTSDAKRTQQTGRIIADRLGLSLNSMNRAETVGLTDKLSFDHEEDTVLIVGHAETIPGILQNLGVSGNIEVSQSDFANLFMLFHPGADEVRLIRLRMP
jgi:phosphohistidine phosphatase SixA